MKPTAGDAKRRKPFQSTIVRHYRPCVCHNRTDFDIPEIKCDVAIEQDVEGVPGEPDSAHGLGGRRSSTSRRKCLHTQPAVTRLAPVAFPSPLQLGGRVRANLHSIASSSTSARVSLSDLKCRMPQIESSNCNFSKSYMQQYCSDARLKQPIDVPRRAIYDSYVKKLRQEIMSNRAQGKYNSRGLIDQLRKEIIQYRQQTKERFVGGEGPFGQPNKLHYHKSGAGKKPITISVQVSPVTPDVPASTEL